MILPTIVRVLPTRKVNDTSPYIYIFLGAQTESLGSSRASLTNWPQICWVWLSRRADVLQVRTMIWKRILASNGGWFFRHPLGQRELFYSGWTTCISSKRLCVPKKNGTECHVFLTHSTEKLQQCWGADRIFGQNPHQSTTWAWTYWYLPKYESSLPSSNSLNDLENSAFFRSFPKKKNSWGVFHIYVALPIWVPLNHPFFKCISHVINL